MKHQHIKNIEDLDLNAEDQVELTNSIPGPLLDMVLKVQVGNLMQTATLALNGMLMQFPLPLWQRCAYIMRQEALSKKKPEIKAVAELLWVVAFAIQENERIIAEGLCFESMQERYAEIFGAESLEKIKENIKKIVGMDVDADNDPTS